MNRRLRIWFWHSKSINIQFDCIKGTIFAPLGLDSTSSGILEGTTIVEAIPSSRETIKSYHEPRFRVVATLQIEREHC